MSNEFDEMHKNRKKVVSIKKNMALNVLRTFVTIFVPMITYPYVARVLKVEDMGKINFSNSIISYFALLAALGVATYAIREGASIKGKKDELNVFISQMFWINMFFTIVAILLLVIFIVTIPIFYKYNVILKIQALTIVFTTIGMEWVNSIDEEFEYIAIRTIFVQIISLVLIFLLVKQESDAIKYVCISTGTIVISGILNLVYVLRRHTISKVNLSMCIKYLPPIVALFINSIAITIYTNSDTTMIRLMNSEYDVGIYSMATKIYFILKSVFSAALAVMLPRVTVLLSEKKTDEYEKIAHQIMHCIWLFVIPTVIGLNIYSKDIIMIFGGEKYGDASLPFCILALALPFAIIANFYSMVVHLPNKKEKVVVLATIIGAMTNIVLNLFFVKNFSYVGAAATTVISEALVAIWLFLCCKQNKTLNVRINDILKIIFASILMTCLCTFINYNIELREIRVLIGIFTAVVSYFMCLFLLKESLIYGYLKRK